MLADIKEQVPRHPLSKAAKCPDCAQLMANMGLDFKAPKRKDNKAWQHLSMLYEVGITFHSCGCGGPGYVPRDQEELVQHLKQIQQQYLAQQHFWARRQEDPTTQSAIDKDRAYNRQFLYALPMAMRQGKKQPSFDAVAAQQYWGQKVQEVDAQIIGVLKKL